MPTSYFYTFVALSGLLVLLLSVLVVALWRFSAAARESRRQAVADRTEGQFMASAMQDALAQLRSHGRALEQRAEASERLSDTIVSGMTSGLLLVDASSRILIVNPAGRRLLGLTGVGDGTRYQDLLGHAAPLAAVIEEGLREGQPIVRRVVSITVPVPATDGRTGHEERHLGVTVSPQSVGESAATGVICLFTDLTKVVGLEEQVRIKESLVLLGEMTAGLAHEFRNGLATIHGYARLLDPARLEPPYAGYVTALREETEALSEVVTNFLNFARPVSVTPRRVDLALVVSRLADEFSNEAAKTGGAVAASGRFGCVEGDEVLLRQALANLCRNALEACVGHGVAPVVVVDGFLEPTANAQVVVVSDNGPGIDPSKLDRIFQPFFTTKSTGTGLGLALVQKIVVTHNGRVTASNGAAGGARFEVRLPLVADGGTSVGPVPLV